MRPGGRIPVTCCRRGNYGRGVGRATNLGDENLKEITAVTVRVGINGFGRIGRNFWRAVQAGAGAASGIEVVAANDLTDAATLAHLLKYDTVLGTLGTDVSVHGDVIRAGDRDIKVLAERDPAALPWGELGVQVV